MIPPVPGRGRVRNRLLNPVRPRCRKRPVTPARVFQPRSPTYPRRDMSYMTCHRCVVITPRHFRQGVARQKSVACLPPVRTRPDAPG